MNAKESPTPRANAGRAKLIHCDCNNKANRVDWEAEATAAFVRLLAALARLGRAIG